MRTMSLIESDVNMIDCILLYQGISYSSATHCRLSHVHCSHNVSSHIGCVIFWAIMMSQDKESPTISRRRTEGALRNSKIDDGKGCGQFTIASMSTHFDGYVKAESSPDT
jgi:hypothetical protein